ncbi:hypothetical protein J4733_29395 [Klebsiella pneumoniae]|uniref:Uncharacterized protein n=1 Tax=Klebsiella pneumoniae TaxID=573 RepID=A0A939NNG0_KLEPN|nr:hypothetical protein [Klebsiella pneumoniae]
MPSGTEPLYWVAAGAYPAYRSLSPHLVGPVNAAPPGDAIRHRAALLPVAAGAYPAYRGLSPITPRRPGAAPPGDAISTELLYAGWRLAPYPAYGPRHVCFPPRREEGLPQALAPSSRAPRRSKPAPPRGQTT